MYRKIIVGVFITILLVCSGCRAKIESNPTTAITPETATAPTLTPTNETSTSQTSDPATKTEDFLEEDLTLAWTFNSDLTVNYIEALTKDTIVIFATDGEISGHHYDDNIYGIDRLTGEKLWVVYGGYFILDYRVSSDGKYVCIEIIEKDERSKLLCLKVDTGKILWEKIFDESSSAGGTAGFYKHLNEIVPGGKLIISSDNRYVKGSPVYITVLDLKTGDVLDEMELPFTALFALSDDASSFILEKDNQLFLYDLSTGSAKKITEEFIVNDSAAPPIKPVYELPKVMHPFKKAGTKWAAFENSFKLLDINKGDVLASIPNSGIKDSIWYSDRLYTFESDTIVVSGSEGFKVYESDGTLLWGKEEKYRAGVFKDELLYYISDIGLKCVNAVAGETVWESEFAFSDSVIRNPVIVGDSIVVAAGDFYIFDIVTGEFKYKSERVDFQKTANVELVDRQYNDYYKTFYGDEIGIYICRENGSVEYYSFEDPAQYFPRTEGDTFRYSGSYYDEVLVLKNIEISNGNIIFEYEGDFFHGADFDEIEGLLEQSVQRKYVICNDSVTECFRRTSKYEEEHSELDYTEYREKTVLKLPFEVGNKWSSQYIINEDKYDAETVIVKIDQEAHTIEVETKVFGVEGYIDDTYIERSTFQKGKGLIHASYLTKLEEEFFTHIRLSED